MMIGAAMMIGLLWMVLGMIGQVLLGFFVAEVILNFQFSVARLIAKWAVGLLIASSILSSRTRVGKPMRKHETAFPSPEANDRDRAIGALDATPPQDPKAFLRRDNPISLAELTGLGCVLGVGLTAWCLFVWSFCGGWLGLLPSGLLAAFGFASGGPMLVARLQFRWWERCSRPLMSDARRQERAACRACQVTITILFIAAVLQTLQTPQKLWDERAIFALKARVLFEDRSIRSDALRHPDFVQYHPRYPLLLPLAEQHVYALLGTVDDRLSKILFSLLYCGLVLTTAGVLQRHLACGRAWLGALLMATVPVMMPYEYGFLCGQADAPIACYHGLCVLYLWDALERQRRRQSTSGSVLMAGICGGLASFTKDEGIAYLVIDATILGLFTMDSFRSPIQLRRTLVAMAGFMAAAGAILLPWFVHRGSLPSTTEMNYFDRMNVELFVGRLDTLRWSVPHLVRRMFWEWKDWGLQWWLMFAAFVSRPARACQWPQLLFVLDIAGALAALVVAGMLAPAQLDEHIGGSSHRFLMQIAPVAVLFAITLFFGHDDEIQTKSETS